MPRGRKKQTQEVAEQTQDQEIEDYFRKYASAYGNTLNSSMLFSPIWTNEILKQINMTPNATYTRDQVKQLIANPRANEKALKDLSQYLFSAIMQYKRLILYMAEMLTFDWYIEPTNADEEDMQSNQFKKSYKKVIQFMNDLDPKLHFPDIIQGALMEDAKFFYLRESDNGYWFQEMPSDFVKIYAKTDLGYLWAFDLSYFLKPGVDIDRDFAPEFREYFDSFVNGEEYQKNGKMFKERRWYYWQTLNPSRALCVKFDTQHAGIVPPLIGTFLDAIEITTFKDLLKSQTALNVYKLLVAKIPIDKDNNKTGKKDNFAVSAESAAKFQAIMQNAVMSGIRVIASPLDVEPINLNEAETKDSIIGLGNQEFWDTSGTSSVLFSGAKMNASTMQASLRTDETFVTHIYRQIMKFYNFKLREISGEYRWKLHMEGTIHDKKDRLERAMELVQYGAPLTYAIVAQGRTQQEFSNMLSLENATGVRDKLKPLASAHTTSNKSGGRPSKNVEDLGDEGTATLDNNGNDRVD